MTGEGANIIDSRRTVCLCDVGRPDYIAATAVGADGQARLVLARVEAINDAWRPLLSRPAGRA